MTYSLQFDGGSNPNPGPCAGAFVLFDEKSNIVAEGGEFIEHGTNNIGEYTGLIIGLKMAKQCNIKELYVQGDSLLVISQVTGKWKVNNEKLKTLCEEVKSLIKDFHYITFTHVLRAKNAHADRLSDLTLHKKQSWNTH
jgi:ribonuclease HI